MSRRWQVLKFGGSSVAAARHWPTIVKLCQQKISEGYSVIVVLSALKNVSNALEALLHQSIAGVHGVAIQRIIDFHYGFASELDIDGEPLLQAQFSALFEYCESINKEQKITPQLYACILACGELLSSTIGVCYLQKHIAQCQWVDVRQWLKATQNPAPNREDDWHHFLSAECDYEYNSEVSKNFSADSKLVVTQGFIGSDSEQNTVLLGREGSDTSAAYLAAIMGAKVLEIWTDVAGFFSTNPREIVEARQIKQLHYNDARRMANFGAKILHPRAITPAEKNNIPILVNDIADPRSTGTIISSLPIGNNDHLFAIVARKNVTQIDFKIDQKVLNQDDILRTIKLLQSLGYDKLLDFISEKNSTKFQQQVVLRFVDTTTAEPTLGQIQTQLLKQQIKVDFKILYGLSMLTFVGEPLGKWLENIENVIKQKLEIKKGDFFSFPKHGRASQIFFKHDAHQALTLLHSEFIEKEVDNGFFGNSWAQIESKRNFS